MSADIRYERNLGFFSAEEQERMQNAVVAVAGAGGDGGLLAVQLARMGIGEIRLADPDPFEIENTNRQAVCMSDTIGVNKAVAVGDYVSKINDNINVVTFTEGINRENAADFVQGADLVIDETEFTMPELGVMLAREARPRMIPVTTALNIGFGAMVTTFRPDGKPLEKVLGLRTDMPIDEVAEQVVGLDRWLPFLPNYIDLEVFKKVATGEKSAPSIAPGVAMAAGLGATQAALNIIGRSNNRPKPIYAPKARIADAMTGQMKEVRFGRPTHYRHLVGLVIRNAAKQHPKASY